MPKWKGGRWHSWAWVPEENLLPEFDQMEYHFVDDDYESGSDMFQRILSVDGDADKKRNDQIETEAEHIEKWRYNPLPQ